MKRLVPVAAVLLLVCAHAPAAAPDGPPAAASAGEGVYTRAIVRDIAEERGKLYIRLKIAPGSKIPFSTLTFRVVDRALLAEVKEGQSVGFRAERIDGENTLTAIRVQAPCARGSNCR